MNYNKIEIKSVVKIYKNQAYHFHVNIITSYLSILKT